MNAQPVGAFFDAGAELAAFGGHGRDAVGFFHPPAGNVAQRGGAVGIQGHDRQGHGGIGDVIAIEVDALEGPGATLNVQSVGIAGDACPHQLCRLDKTDVALNRVGAHALHRDALAIGQRAQRDEVAGRGRIGFHMDAAGAAVMAARWNDKARPALALHRNAVAS